MSEPMPRTDPPSLPELDRMVNMANRIPRDSVVRQSLLKVIRGDQLESIEPLLHELSTNDALRARYGEAAAWALGNCQLTAKETEAAEQALMSVLENRRREPLHKRAIRCIVRSYLGGGLAGVGLVSLGMIFAPSRFNGLESPILALLQAALMGGTAGLPLVVSLSLLYDIQEINRVRVEAARALGNMGTVESIGSLLVALSDRSENVRTAAAVALNRLLPELGPEHYGTFGNWAVLEMAKALEHPDNQLVMKVFTALELVGTGAAVPAMEKATQKARTAKMRDRADEVLAILRVRHDQERMRNTLLRPSNRPDNDYETLLRPASFQPDANPERLLRPIEGD